ncbi:MAG: hypothetical protein GX780_04375 [Campylobacteraceae bacterium]|nr:hypothetical protein [Campylobacteraceae bacterium]
MREKFRLFNEMFSTKTKTTILVLALFILLSFVFVYLRYLDTKNFTEESQIFYAERIHSVYTETLKRTEDFYRNRGFANLNSFGVSSALENENVERLRSLSEFRWNVLKNENSYLSSMAFYNSSGKLLTFLGKKVSPKLNIQKATFGFWLDSELCYRVVVPWRDSGYIAFEIDPRFFLAEIVELIGLEGLIVFNEKELISLKESQIETIFKRSLDSKNEIKNEFVHKNIFYKTHRIFQTDAKNEENFKILFFQDISAYKDRLSDALLENVIIVMILAVVVFLALHVGFEVLIRRIEELNRTLEKRVELEIQKRMANEKITKEKEQMLVHQSKLASMGEMIGNIAHQWRQPLTQLGTILIGIELLYERNRLTVKDLREKICQAEGQISFMSNTIDDFRNFFASDKSRTTFSINKSIESAIFLMDSVFKNNNIKCYFKCQDNLLANGYANEVSQVLLNLMANAKDVLLERKIKNPYIDVRAYREDEYIKIDIQDNGGGVGITPIEKIFEPYVSTKHASAGTGIGLYMSKIIIEKNSFGNLSVKNTPQGAMFSITLPAS